MLILSAIETVDSPFFTSEQEVMPTIKNKGKSMDRNEVFFIIFIFTRAKVTLFLKRRLPFLKIIVYLCTEKALLVLILPLKVV
jgi:hypothetical protein